MQSSSLFSESMTKKILTIFLLVLLPITCAAQFLGIGAQYVNTKIKENSIEFAANISYPYWHKKNSFNTFISGGLDYTGGNSLISGLNIKPISVSTFLNEQLFNHHSFTFMISADAGYLFNFRHGKNGIVLTPNLYADYKYFFVKTGWDFNINEGSNQFFIRAGLSIGMGTFKMFPNTKIW